MSKFVNHNGIFINAETPLFSINNRAFCYGDAIFETIRWAYHQPQFIKEHLQRLKNGVTTFKMYDEFELDEKVVKRAIHELVEKNNIGADARIRLTIYRNDGGLYAPINNTISYLLQAEALEDNGYILNNKGYTVDIYNELKKAPSALSALKTANSALYVMAGIYKNEHALDECILMNDKNNITEAISSNIFAVKNGVLYTSPISDGCINGVMRKKIIEIAQANRIAVYETTITQSVLLGADELFLTNAINGIRWIVAYKQKRYFNDTSKKLITKLNEIALK